MDINLQAAPLPASTSVRSQIIVEKDSITVMPCDFLLEREKVLISFTLARRANGSLLIEGAEITWERPIQT